MSLSVQPLLVSDLMVISHVITIDSSNQSAGNANYYLSLINQSEQMSMMTVQNNEHVQSSQLFNERNQQSIPSSSSGLPLPKRKQEMFGDDVNSNEDVCNEEEEETKLQIVTLEVNCTEPGCKTILKSLEKWKQHLSLIHGLMPYKQLEDSVRLNQHGQTEYICTECNTMHKSQSSHYLHWRNYHQAGKFECSLCAFVGNFRGEVCSHQMKAHRSRSFQCTYEGCDRAFKNKPNLERHERIHNGERPFMCIWNNCHVTFNQLASATHHVRTVHFQLPKTAREQKELNIIDERDPKLYIQVS